MNAIDFLNSDAADLPKTRHGDYHVFVSDLFEDYKNHLGRVTVSSFIDRMVRSEFSLVNDLSKSILQIINLLLSGDQTTAYVQLDTLLNGLGARLRALMPSGDMSHFINPVYRLRGSGKRPFTAGELFHIPFYLKRKVGPMRYSSAGLPCLYLGGSTHVCWRELGEPALSSVSVSRFQAVPGTNLRVLNFGHRLPLLASYVANVPQDFGGPTNACAFVKAQVACWPLVAACSIRVPDRTASERPEYLLPQLVLEWLIRTHRFHGIRYFSTHYTEYPDDPKTYMNYVFPAVTTPSVGYCPELCRLFELSDPICWDQAKGLSKTVSKRPRYKTREVIDAALEAEFGATEDRLATLPTRTLESVPSELLCSIRHDVAVKAYGKWDGRSHGHDWEHWFAARRELEIPDNIDL